MSPLFNFVIFVALCIIWIRPCSCCGPLGGVGQAKEIVNLNLECDEGCYGSAQESRANEVALPSPDNTEYIAEEMEAYVEEETCNLCNCLTKSMPTSAKSGHFIFTDGNKDDSTSVLVESRSDMSSSADSFRPAYAAPPDHFSPGAFNAGDDDSESDAAAKIHRGLKKVVHLANVAGQLNQYFSDRAKSFFIRIGRLFEDE